MKLKLVSTTNTHGTPQLEVAIFNPLDAAGKPTAQQVQITAPKGTLALEHLSGDKAYQIAITEAK